MGKVHAALQTPRGRMKKSTAPKRPPIGTILYRPEYCERLIAHMAMGHSFAAFGGSVRVARRTLYLWLDTYPEFREAHEVATLACQNTLESIGLKGMIGGIKGFNPTPWIFMLKNICGWRDVQQHEHVGDAARPIAVQTLQEAFAKVAVQSISLEAIEKSTQEAFDNAGNGKGNGRGLVH